MFPRPERLAQVLKFARLNYAWTVVDLSSGLSDSSLGLLDHLDSTFLVTTPDVLALARTRQIVEVLTESSYPRERLHLVVNRTTLCAPLALKDIERLVGLGVEAVLPHAADDLATAYAHGKLVRAAACWVRSSPVSPPGWQAWKRRNASHDGAPFGADGRLRRGTGRPA